MSAPVGLGLKAGRVGEFAGLATKSKLFQNVARSSVIVICFTRSLPFEVALRVKLNWERAGSISLVFAKLFDVVIPIFAATKLMFAPETPSRVESVNVGAVIVEDESHLGSEITLLVEL